MLPLLAASILFGLAALPVAMFVSNLRIFLPATDDSDRLAAARAEKVSVLIPARNEAAGIGATLEAVLANRGIEFEVIVQDDLSEDATAEIVRHKMTTHPNLRLLDGIPLPDGWNGKQHACWRLANAASYDWFLFLDADVRLQPDAIQRMVAQAVQANVPLLSGFPHQETGTLAEKMLIPMMHFLLLGYLPMARMRTSKAPGLAAGCGQLFLAEREAYFKTDGHRAIASSRHDGIKLPRSFRSQGLSSDVFDACDIADCRMYRNRTEVVRGLLKNADEGIANPILLSIFTILLGGAAILPVPGLIAAWLTGQSTVVLGVLIAASALSFVPRWLAARRFRQSFVGVLLHPPAVAWFLLLQYRALVGKALGRRIAWRGRP